MRHYDCCGPGSRLKIEEVGFGEKRRSSTISDSKLLLYIWGHILTPGPAVMRNQCPAKSGGLTASWRQGFRNLSHCAYAQLEGSFLFRNFPQAFDSTSDHGFKRIPQSSTFSNRRECVLHQPIQMRTHIRAVIDYYDNIEKRRVLSNVEPGYLQKILPVGPPEEGEEWQDIQNDIEEKIMPGLTHWYVVRIQLADLLKLKLNRSKAIPQFHGFLSRRILLPVHSR